MRNTPILVLVCVIITATFATAQVPTGTISGRVVSSDDAPLPGATVTVTSPSLQGERTVVTTENGDYVIPLLPPGDYTLAFELSGFQTLKRQVGRPARRTVSLNVTLAVGAVVERLPSLATPNRLSRPRPSPQSSVRS